MIGYFLVYLVWGLLLIRNYSDKIPQFASNLDKIRLDWLKYTLYLFIFLAVVLAPLFLLIGKIDYMVVGMMYFTTFLYLWIVYRSMNHSPVFINEMAALQKSSKEKNEEKEEIVAPLRYQYSSLNTEKLQVYYEQLQDHFLTKKPYLNPELSLKMLSDQTRIPAHYISRVVNEFYQKSFFDQINFFRVEEFKQKLKDPANKKFSLEGLAFDCGFGSKAAFQRAFLKNMEITPSEYRKSLQHLQEAQA